MFQSFCASFFCNSMPFSVCSALHGVNPDFFFKKNLMQSLFLCDAISVKKLMKLSFLWFISHIKKTLFKVSMNFSMQCFCFFFQVTLARFMPAGKNVVDFLHLK